MDLSLKQALIKVAQKCYDPKAMKDKETKAIMKKAGAIQPKIPLTKRQIFDLSSNLIGLFVMQGGRRLMAHHHLIYASKSSRENFCRYIHRQSCEIVNGKREIRQWICKCLN
jgi:hypothetical protein